MTGGKLNPTYVKGGGVVSAERNIRSFQIRTQLTTHPCFQYKDVNEIGFSRFSRYCDTEAFQYISVCTHYGKQASVTF